MRAIGVATAARSTILKGASLWRVQRPTINPLTSHSSLEKAVPGAQSNPRNEMLSLARLCGALFIFEKGMVSQFGKALRVRATCVCC
jgi:hypothetical protein